MSVPIPSAKSKPGFYGGTDAKVRIKHLINITKVLFNTILTVRNSTFHSKMPLLTNHQEFTIVESVVCTHHVWHVLGLVIIMGKALPLCGIGFVKNKATKTPLGMFIDSPYCVYTRVAWQSLVYLYGYYYNILRGGFRRCSFRQTGHAKASTRGTGDRTGSTFEPKLYFAIIDYQHVTGVRLILWYHNVPKQ